MGAFRKTNSGHVLRGPSRRVTLSLRNQAMYHPSWPLGEQGPNSKYHGRETQSHWARTELLISRLQANP